MFWLRDYHLSWLGATYFYFLLIEYTFWKQVPNLIQDVDINKRSPLRSRKGKNLKSPTTLVNQKPPLYGLRTYKLCMGEAAGTESDPPPYKVGLMFKGKVTDTNE